MATAKKAKQSARTAVPMEPSAKDIVLFQGPKSSPVMGAVSLHSFGSISDKLFGRTVEDVKDDFDRISEQLTTMLASSFSKATAGMELDSVEVKLAFTAEGKLAFIAKAGLETSVTITLKRVKKAGD